MGKANFSHLASQNILIVIFLIIVVLYPPRLQLKGVGLYQRYSVFLMRLAITIIYKSPDRHKRIKNNDLCNFVQNGFAQSVTLRHPVCKKVTLICCVPSHVGCRVSGVSATKLFWRYRASLPAPFQSWTPDDL